MSKLVNELKKEHQEITDILLKLQEFGMLSTNGMELLKQSEALFLSHLAKEDEKLYPILHKKAQYDLALKKMLDVFGEEMDKITEFVLEFYEKYTDNNTFTSEFIKDIAKFIVTLKARIMKEEIAIYKEYEKLEID